MATRMRPQQQSKRPAHDEEEEEEEEGSSPEVNNQAQQRLSDGEDTRRKIRRQYHKLINQTIEHKQQLTEPGKDDLLKNIETGNKLFSHVTHAREGALDAQWFSYATKFGYEQVLKIPVGKQFDPVEFIDKLKDKYKNNKGEFDWYGLGKDVAPLYYRYVPSVTFMNGPMHAEPKAPKERKQSKRKQLDNEKAQAPEEITQQQKEDANETTMRVARVVDKLKKVQSAKQANNEEALFEEVLVDPNSFTKTIENIFYFSFLVKDGKAALKRTTNENNEHQIVVAPAVPVADQPQKKQCVMKLDLAHFQQLARRAQEKQMHLNLGGSSASSSNSHASANGKRSRQEMQQDESESSQQQQQKQPDPKRRRN